MTSPLDHPPSHSDGGWRTLQIKQKSFDTINARQPLLNNSTGRGEIEMQKKEEISEIMKHKKNYKKIISFILKKKFCNKTQ
jgi:hypothetical protein